MFVIHLHVIQCKVVYQYIEKDYISIHDLEAKIKLAEETLVLHNQMRNTENWPI